MHDRGRGGAPGLTTEEEEEGRRAKAALEAGEGGEGDEDGEGGDYKERGKFFTHLKKTEARGQARRAGGGRARGGRAALRGAAPWRAPPGPARRRDPASGALALLDASRGAPERPRLQRSTSHACWGPEQARSQGGGRRRGCQAQGAGARARRRPASLPRPRRWRSSGSTCPCTPCATSCCRSSARTRSWWWSARRGPARPRRRARAARGRGSAARAPPARGGRPVMRARLHARRERPCTEAGQGYGIQGQLLHVTARHVRDACAMLKYAPLPGVTWRLRRALCQQACPESRQRGLAPISEQAAMGALQAASALRPVRASRAHGGPAVTAARAGARR
jgi:hypothetical protein